MRKMKSPALAMLALVVTALAGCDSGDSAGDARQQAGAPQHGGTITVAMDAETPGWYPPNGLIGYSGRVVNRLVYGSLTTGQPDGGYTPYLAKSVTPDKTFTTWTIGLRDGMTFQDGSPFDGEAVANSISATSDPKAAVGAVYSFIKSVDAVDDLTVKVELNKPLSSFPSYLAGGLGQIFSMTAVEKAGVDAFNSAPVGAGPYAMENWAVDNRMTLRKFDGFFDEDAALPDEIVLKPIPDDAARAAALKAGDVDAIFTQSATDILSFRNSRGFTIREDSVGVNGFFVNMATAPLNDIRIREAIDYGLDKEALIDLVWKGVGDVAQGRFPHDSPWATDVPRREHDRDKARKLVQAYVAESGVKPSFELIAPPSATYGALSQVVKQQLADVGIEVTIGTVTDAANQTTRNISGDFGLSAGVMDAFLDPDFEMGKRYESKSPFNYNRFKNPAVDAALKTAQSTGGLPERRKAYAEVQRLIAKNVAGIFVRENTVALITKGNVHYAPKGGLGEYFTPVLADRLWRE